MSNILLYWHPAAAGQYFSAADKSSFLQHFPSRLRMMLEAISVILLLLLCLGDWYPTTTVFVDAANWAQASGKVAQNTVIPYLPSPGTPHWTARYGMVTIGTPSNALGVLGDVFLLGGDTYDGSLGSDNHAPGLLDRTWENGYKNDVWKMGGTEWTVKGDIRLRTEYDQKVPTVTSQLEWTEVQQGLRPRVGTTHDQWLQCNTEYFQNSANLDPNLVCGQQEDVMWSPRRHHAGLYFEQANQGNVPGFKGMYIMGGRAREFVRMAEERTVGGIIGPRVADIPTVEANRRQRFTIQREVSIHKSDVWRSTNGFEWELVTPGCRVQDEDNVARGNPQQGKVGRVQFACQVDSDCYGQEFCTISKTCACRMWGPREQHAVAAYNGFMYVVGGFASVLYTDFSNCGPYACGDTDASGYRFYLSDIWRSGDGENWERVTDRVFAAPLPAGGTLDALAPQPLGRGGHQAVVVDSELWIVGGRGGDNGIDGGIDTEVYYNDIWRSSLEADFPTEWNAMQEHMPWAPRTGHTVTLEPRSPANGFVRTLYIVGGYNNGSVAPHYKESGGFDRGGQFLDDVWAWRLDDPNEFWRQDFTGDALFSTGSGPDGTLRYANNSPSVAYIAPSSPISQLQRYWVPRRELDSVTGRRLEVRPYMTAERIQLLNEEGIYTVQDLANIGLYSVLKLRGFDYPQVALEDRLDFTDICDFRALAIKVVDKCNVQTPNLFDGQRQMPWNVRPVFGGPPPDEDPPLWHGRDNYDFLLPEVDDPDVLTDNWDGCTYFDQIQGLFGPNVNGLGNVDQVLSVRDPQRELDELFCRQTPRTRAYHSAVLFEERLYVFGGKQSEEKFYADTWYRDAKLPTATIQRKPRERTPDFRFTFTADKPGTFFEYQVWDPHKFKVLRPWTQVVRITNIGWLDWREGGPGNGRYRLYVRGIDPAGNRDERFILGQNVHDWYYVSPTPWDIILAVIGSFIGLCLIAYFEYRRRVKKAAMERYAMKRMRRKFKAMQRDINGKAVDWRTLYMENKQAEELGLNKRTKKKKRDKNAEKREKEKKKREKEKEKIKKKLKMAKEHKQKGASGGKVVPGGSVSDRETEIFSSAKAKQKAGFSSRKGGGVVAIELEDELDEEDKKAATGLRGSKRRNAKSGLKHQDSINIMGFEAEDDVMMKKKGKKDKGDPLSALGSGGVREVLLGASPASTKAHTETGTKQRRVNKRLKAYEVGGPEEKEEKDDEAIHLGGARLGDTPAAAAAAASGRGNGSGPEQRDGELKKDA